MNVARVLIVVAVAAVGCGFTVPTPKTGPHESEEPIEVPFPPPPARVELIPKPPEAKKKVAVWVDGAWEWKGHRWVWLAGDWEVPQPNSYYAPPMTVRLSDGTLAYFPGAWKGVAGAPEAAPLPAAPTDSTPAPPPSTPAPSDAAPAPDATTAPAAPESKPAPATK